jgi:hypothetical protein
MFLSSLKQATTSDRTKKLENCPIPARPSAAHSVPNAPPA